MKNITLKIIVSLVCCSLVIALILSGFAVSQSRDVMQAEVQKELLYASRSYASQFSRTLETQENVVDLICTMVSVEFTAEEYRGDRLRFLFLENKLKEVIRSTMENIPEAQSLYLTFNPGTSGGNDEVWYLRDVNGKVYYKEADNTAADWLVDDGGAESAYYFEAVRKGSSWSGVEYDKHLDKYSVTYSRACLDRNGDLIGVMGSDIFLDHIFNTVKNIQLEEGGYAFLTDNGFNYLAGSSPQEDFHKLVSRGILEPPDQTGSPGDMQTVPADAILYSGADGERYLSAYAETSNDWILTLVQSEEALLRPIRDMKQILYTMAGLILIGVLAYSYYFFKRALIPIVKEYEQKDIIMLHQSRQAKLGEMVGNIAHQWKQPLNVMSIILSNLKDDGKDGGLTEDRLKAHIDDMRSCIRLMSGTVDDFAEFLKPSRKKETFSCNEAVDTALELMQESIKINRILVKKEYAEELKTYGYRNEFCQGVFNILNNARDAIMESDPEKREIRIGISAVKGIKGKLGTDVNQKSCIIIDIGNTGARIPEQSLPLLFEPYFTTKEEKGGTGIGLYLTKEIIESHMDGSIQLFNSEDGVCCRIRVPEDGGNGPYNESPDSIKGRVSRNE